MPPSSVRPIDRHQHSRSLRVRFQAPKGVNGAASVRLKHKHARPDMIAAIILDEDSTVDGVREVGGDDVVFIQSLERVIGSAPIVL